MRISDWSSDVCSSDLLAADVERGLFDVGEIEPLVGVEVEDHAVGLFEGFDMAVPAVEFDRAHLHAGENAIGVLDIEIVLVPPVLLLDRDVMDMIAERARVMRSEEHTSELQSLMRISYAVFCLKTKKDTKK